MSDPAVEPVERNETDLEDEKSEIVSREALVGLGIAYLSVFIDILGVSIILPIIPFLAIKFDASPQQIGYIYAGYAGAQMISVPVSGKLSDKFGRRPLMLVSLFGSFAGFMFQGLAWNIISFILARVVAGAFGGSIPICQSYIADVIPVKQRARYFAILGSVIITAFLFGPGIGAGLAQFSLQTPMFVAAAVALCGWIVAFFFFQEPKKLLAVEEKASTEIQLDIESEDETAGILSSDAAGDRFSSSAYVWLVRILWMVSFFHMLAFSSVIYFFGLFVFDQFGWEPLEVGFATMLMGIFQVVVQLTVFPKLQAVIGKHICGMLGCIIAGVGLLLLGFVTGDALEFTGIALMSISLAIISFGNSICVPSLSAVLSRYAAQTKQGSTLGVAQAMEALARTVGPLVWGSVYSSSRHLPFQIAAVCYAVAAILFYSVFFRNSQLPEHAAIEQPKGGVVEMSTLDETVSVEDQLQGLLQENKRLKDRVRMYEETYNIDSSEVLEDVQGSFQKM